MSINTAARRFSILDTMPFDPGMGPPDNATLAGDREALLWLYSGLTSGGATAPATPVAPVATGGNTIASVVLTAPSDGGSAITGYTVVSSPGGGTDTDAGTTALTHHITGLSNGTPYTFTFTATNAIGPSSASPASNSITPAVQATAFTLSGPSSGNYKVASTAFTVGSDNPVSVNTVVTLTDSSGHGSFSPPTLTILAGQSTASGTATYTPTTAGARNINVSGALTPPANVVYTSNAVVPSAPPSVFGAAGDTQITVSGSVPDDGGSPITGYVADDGLGGHTTASGPLPRMVTGLTNGVARTPRMAAVNAVGQGPFTSATSPSVPAVPAFRKTGAMGHRIRRQLRHAASPKKRT